MLPDARIDTWLYGLSSSGPGLWQSVLDQSEVVDAGWKGSGGPLVQTPTQSSTSLDLQMSSSTAEVS